MIEENFHVISVEQFSLFSKKSQCPAYLKKLLISKNTKTKHKTGKLAKIYYNYYHCEVISMVIYSGVKTGQRPKVRGFRTPFILILPSFYRLTYFNNYFTERCILVACYAQHSLIWKLWFRVDLLLIKNILCKPFTINFSKSVFSGCCRSWI